MKAAGSKIFSILHTLSQIFPHSLSFALLFTSSGSPMGSPPVRSTPPTLPLLLGVLLLVGDAAEGAAQWCIARSGAGQAELQAALDYACGPPGGADCQPIHQSGLCYLPNTLAAHASYAFNSYFQRSKAAPGACDFAGTAAVTITDPSYGSCTFPSSASTAGGSTGPPNSNTPSTSPLTKSPPTPGTGPTTGGIGGLTPAGGLSPGNGLTPSTGSSSGFGSTVPDTDDEDSGTCGSPLPLLIYYTLCCCLLHLLLL